MVHTVKGQNLSNLVFTSQVNSCSFLSVLCKECDVAPMFIEQFIVKTMLFLFQDVFNNANKI